MTVPVVTSSQAGALDAACIAGGTPSRTLMQRAGAAAADAIVSRLSHEIAGAVAVFPGPGNNGGDAWVVARKLAALGIDVRVREVLAPATVDATAERQAALSATQFAIPDGSERVVIDGLLGTGSLGVPRGPIAQAIPEIERMRAAGATVVSLDLPTGLDASTGESRGGLSAHMTLSLGTAKRGQLLNRACCGKIIVLDIGLGSAAGHPTLARLVDHDWVMQRIPRILPDSHKGKRGRLAIVGGSPGMTGAVILAADGAQRSGIGLVRLVVPDGSLPVVQTAAPLATAARWPESAERAGELFAEWADAIVLGPGLGIDQAARSVVHLVATVSGAPIVVDADAISICAAETGSLTRIAALRKTVVTPHPGEMCRLTGLSVDSVLAQRFEIATELARTSGAVCLLKGVPTIVAAPDGRVNVCATGSPVLATGGSGDILAGILGTLLAQTDDAFDAATCAAWVHGRAAELAVVAHGVRGRTLMHVLAALSEVWSLPAPVYEPFVLAELPEVTS